MESLETEHKSSIFNSKIHISEKNNSLNNKKYSLVQNSLPDINSSDNFISESCCAEYSNIFVAAKAGLLTSIQEQIEKYGQNVFQHVDEKGFTVAHWVCLRGHSDILHYLIELNGPFNEPAHNDVSQHPIHWACINGHINIIELLLGAGVSVETIDRKGCTPLMIAAQNGHVMLCGYLIGRGASVDPVDREGDNALHWAAFKGSNEIMRLLIYSGLSPHLSDYFGQTPLHLACISGSLPCVRELCELDKVDVNVMDKEGRTPRALAMGRRHDEVADYLKRESKRRFRGFKSVSVWLILFGPLRKTKAGILFLILSFMIWAYPVYLFKYVPVLWSEQEILNYIFLMNNVVMWVSLCFSVLQNPGFVPINMVEYDLCLKQMMSASAWKQMSESPLTRLCHICRCVQPIRSKHCKVCARCVIEFDHHCPYIYNCVGSNNRGWFFVFLSSIFTVILIGDYFAVSFLSAVGWDTHAVIGLTLITIFLFLSGITFVITVQNMLLNQTMNERFRYAQYKHLQDEQGHYRNPFNRGILRNVAEFFRLIMPQAVESHSILDVTVM